MMRVLQNVFAFSSILSILLLLTGLYKPWMVLWWRSSQNRRTVLRLYGLVFVVSVAGFLLVANAFK